MLVVRVNDFCIPSDENDYDELVAFADTMASIEQFEAIPKTDYETRLKAAMVAMLEEIKQEIEELDYFDKKERINITQELIDEIKSWECGVKDCKKLIQNKINALGGQDGNDE